MRIEEYTRTITDITAQKTRIYNENIEITKEYQEIKITLDNTNHIKSQLASQLEDTRRRLEDEDRVSDPSTPSDFHCISTSNIFHIEERGKLIIYLWEPNKTCDTIMVAYKNLEIWSIHLFLNILNELEAPISGLGRLPN